LSAQLCSSSIPRHARGGGAPSPLSLRVVWRVCALVARRMACLRALRSAAHGVELELVYSLGIALTVMNDLGSTINFSVLLTKARFRKLS